MLGKKKYFYITINDKSIYIVLPQFIVQSQNFPWKCFFIKWHYAYDFSQQFHKILNSLKMCQPEAKDNVPSFDRQPNKIHNGNGTAFEQSVINYLGFNWFRWILTIVYVSAVDYTHQVIQSA